MKIQLLLEDKEIKALLNKLFEKDYSYSNYTFALRKLEEGLRQGEECKKRLNGTK